MPSWLVFAVSAAVVILAGLRLARDAGAIAERTGLGGMWVGAILVAAATSLPELLTGLYAISQGTPNLALGDLFGAGMVGMLVLGVVDLASRQGRVLTRVAINQVLIGVMAITLTAIAAAGTLVGEDVVVLGLGWAPLAVGFGYVAGMRLLQLNRAGPPFRPRAESASPNPRAPSVRRAAIGFALAAVVLLVAARFLAGSAAQLSEQLGVSTGFLGLALLALVTTLPETVVTVASVRAGAYDLAVGNLLGSAAFCMLILLPLDLADGPGSLLAGAQPAILLGALFTIVLVGQVLLDILNKPERRIWYLEPGPVFLILTYALALYFMYRVGE